LKPAWDQNVEQFSSSVHCLPQVVNEHGVQLTSAALADMVYLEAVLKEAMRLLPAARVGMRQATTDMTLSGVQIPKGSYIIWSIDAAHALDPTLWQGPDSIPAGELSQPLIFATALSPSSQSHDLETWLAHLSADEQQLLSCRVVGAAHAAAALDSALSLIHNINN